MDVGIYVWSSENAAYQYVVTKQDGVSARDSWERFEMDEDAEIRQYMFEMFEVPIDGMPIDSEKL
ncbi:hypothetical protein P9B03_02205 [Metasolibacillus meyeri]|uniref:Uncharacterized protein n=1 Tax=Metasolibacillus meyeri TaxID=1071052 RepID=A0AAW9NNH8_9BACL|nr:hypothetical protein [Metasolibacillus meyeri]MEC1177284.1 hypothetical protein [Metasolibacillus meyeri]